MLADRPGRAPGLLAGTRVNARLALVHHSIVHPDAHDAVCANARSRWAICPGQAAVSPAGHSGHRTVGMSPRLRP